MILFDPGAATDDEDHIALDALDFQLGDLSRPGLLEALIFIDTHGDELAAFGFAA
jgi:hypothetical protein